MRKPTFGLHPHEIVSHLSTCSLTSICFTGFVSLYVIVSKIFVQKKKEVMNNEGDFSFGYRRRNILFWITALLNLYYINLYCEVSLSDNGVRVSN